MNMLDLIQNTGANSVAYTLWQMIFVLVSMLLFNLLPATISVILWSRGERRHAKPAGKVIEGRFYPTRVEVGQERAA